jgi:putative membrane protein
MAESETPKSRNPLLLAAAAACIAIWIWAAIAPFDRTDWLLENMLLVAAVALLIRVDLERPLSDASHGLIAVFFVLHTTGAHYTYSETPLGHWIKEAFDLDRNHYDRIVHFAFGLLLAMPIRELLMRRSGIAGGASLFFTGTVIATSSEVYELIEWAVAQIADPAAAMAYLGTQGDPFDAQKDTGLALIGAVIALTAIGLSGKRRVSP